MKFLVSVALMFVLVTTKGSTPPDRTIEKVPLSFAETMNSLKNSISLLDSESAKLLKDQFLQLFADKATGTVDLRHSSQQQTPPSPDVVPAKSRRERRQKRQQDQKQQTQQLRGNAAPAPQITVGQNQQQNPQQQQKKKSRPTITAASASETRPPLFVSPSNGTDISTHPIAVIKCFNQTQCIQPKLQLVKSYDAYLCKHIGQGVRFYFLGTCTHTYIPSRSIYPI